jgi:hypothetical protein
VFFVVVHSIALWSVQIYLSLDKWIPALWSHPLRLWKVKFFLRMVKLEGESDISLVHIFITRVL